MTDDADSDRTATRSEALQSVGEPTTADAGRRSVLRGTVAAGLAALGATGTAAAVAPTGRTELDLRARAFRARRSVPDVVDDLAGDLLGSLADDGYIESASLDAFDDHGVGAWYVDGTASVRIDARLDRGPDSLTFSVEPDGGRAYAISGAPGDRTLHRMTADGTHEEVSVTADGTGCIVTRDITICAQCEEFDFFCQSDGSCMPSLNGNCCLGCPEGCDC